MTWFQRVTAQLSSTLVHSKAQPLCLCYNLNMKRFQRLPWLGPWQILFWKVLETLGSRTYVEEVGVSHSWPLPVHHEIKKPLSPSSFCCDVLSKYTSQATMGWALWDWCSRHSSGKDNQYIIFHWPRPFDPSGPTQLPKEILSYKLVFRMANSQPHLQ